MNTWSQDSTPWRMSMLSVPPHRSLPADAEGHLLRPVENLPARGLHPRGQRREDQNNSAPPFHHEGSQSGFSIELDVNISHDSLVHRCYSVLSYIWIHHELAMGLPWHRMDVLLSNIHLLVFAQHWSGRWLVVVQFWYLTGFDVDHWSNQWCVLEISIDVELDGFVLTQYLFSYDVA